MPLRKLVIKLIFVLLFINANAQVPDSVQKYLLEVNLVDWRSHNPRLTEHFDKVLSKYNILVLAESSHGHGTSMDAQAMILKSLIDSGKITALYLESNWMNCDRINSILIERGKEGISEAERYFNSSELHYWKKTGFWYYLADKIIEGKLRLRGFDISGISPLIVAELYGEALKMERIKQLEEDDSAVFKHAFFALGGRFEGWGDASTYYNEYYILLKRFVDILLTEYTSQNNTYRIKQWKSLLSFFYWMVKRAMPLRNNYYVNQIKNEKQRTAFHAVRDSLMAVSFLDQFREENGKVACSMSSYHALRRSYKIEAFNECCKEASVKTMLEWLDPQLGNKIYSVCFITASGEYGILKSPGHQALKVRKSKKNSLEGYLSKKDIDYCFIDFPGDWLHTLFYMNALGENYRKSAWAINYSGVFFIKQMKPLVLY